MRETANSGIKRTPTGETPFNLQTPHISVVRGSQSVMWEAQPASDIVKTIEIYESPADLESLGQGGFKLCLAHTFLAKRDPVSNLTWKSLSLAPTTPITWQASYALNWTEELPSSNSDPISPSGFWQPCKKGEAYDLGTTGLWSQSAETPVPGKLMVGVNRFKGEMSKGIFIVIGLKGKEEGKFDPVCETKFY